MQNIDARTLHEEYGIPGCSLVAIWALRRVQDTDTVLLSLSERLRDETEKNGKTENKARV